MNYEEKTRMMLANEKLVWKAAQPLLTICKVKRIEEEDLISEGNIGLWHAINRFDPDKGLQFSTYAYHCIQGHMLTHIARRGDFIRIPSTIHAKKQAHSAEIPVVSFDAYLAKRRRKPDPSFQLDISSIVVHDFINQLTPEQQKIVTTLMENKSTQTSLAEEFGISYEWFRRSKLKPIREKLRNYLEQVQ